MRLPDEIREALKQNKSDILSWIVLLQFFKEHKKDLNHFQKRTIYLKCQECLDHWNTEEKKSEEIVKPGSGVLIKIDNIRQSLDIEIDNIRPNDIYLDKTLLDNSSSYYLRQLIRQFRQFYKNIIPIRDA